MERERMTLAPFRGDGGKKPLKIAGVDTPLFQTSPPEYAKPQEGQANEGGTVITLAVGSPTDERQAQLRAIASKLLYWRGGLKVLRMAQLPKWRGCFKWQIEALQAAYARLRAEAAKPDG